MIHVAKKSNNAIKITLLASLLILSCGRSVNKKFPEEDYYIKFRHVEEINDEDNILVGYKLLDDKLSEQERDTLIQILEEEHRLYKVTYDGDVLIAKITLGDLDGLNGLDGKLFRRMHKMPSTP